MATRAGDADACSRRCWIPMRPRRRRQRSAELRGLLDRDPARAHRQPRADGAGACVPRPSAAPDRTAPAAMTPPATTPQPGKPGASSAGASSTWRPEPLVHLDLHTVAVRAEWHRGRPAGTRDDQQQHRQREHARVHRESRQPRREPAADDRRRQRRRRAGRHRASTSTRSRAPATSSSTPSYRTQNAIASNASTDAEYLNQVQSALNEPSSSGISTQLSQFWSDWNSLADNPTEHRRQAGGGQRRRRRWPARSASSTSRSQLRSSRRPRSQFNALTADSGAR